MSAASPLLTLEDFEPGRVFDLGSATLDADEIVGFARRWDPQPFHLDADAAVAGGLDGLIASGWQTACLWMRLYVDAVLSRADMLPAPGVEALRWHRPVTPGMRLHGRATILERAVSERDPTRGRMRLRGELHDDDGETVLTLDALGRARRADAGESIA